MSQYDGAKTGAGSLETRTTELSGSSGFPFSQREPAFGMTALLVLLPGTAFRQLGSAVRMRRLLARLLILWHKI